jgi:hypothetical protein
MSLPSVQPLQWLSPSPTSSTPQSSGNGVGDGNGSNGYGGKLLQRLLPLPTSLTPQSNGNGHGLLRYDWEEGGDGGHGPWFVCVFLSVWRDHKK